MDMTSYPDLKGRVVLITGGGNGIGVATVRAFHKQGARVFFCDLDARSGRALAKDLSSNITFTRLDLAKERQICRWIGDIGRQCGRIDVLVNNAASDPRIPLEQTSATAWDNLFARNLRAYFLTARESVQWMKGNGSSIINLASITFHTGPANLSAYVATKGGILAFTRSLARELGPRRIRANTVSPGWVMTERQLREFVTAPTKRLIKQSQCVPDLIEPEEIARVILFLASSASAAITGQEILVDRGWAHS